MQLFKSANWKLQAYVAPSMFILSKLSVNCGRLSKTLWLLKNTELKINHWIFYVFKYMSNTAYIQKKKTQIFGLWIHPSIVICKLMVVFLFIQFFLSFSFFLLKHRKMFCDWPGTIRCLLWYQTFVL